MSGSSSSRWAPDNAPRPDRPVWTSSRVAAAKQQEQVFKGTPEEINGTTSSRSTQAGAKGREAWGGAQTATRRPSATKAPPRASPSTSAAPATSAMASSSTISAQISKASIPATKASEGTSRSAPAFVRRQDKQLGGQIDPMALIASPSRGLDDGEAGRNIARVATGQEDVSQSMDLTIHAVQVEFRSYISRRIASHIETHGRNEVSCGLSALGPSKLASKQEARQHGWEQVGLLCRKLREGVVASGRVDGFAIEAYMLSAFVSLFANNLNQLHTALSRLVLGLYPAIVTPSASSEVDTLAKDLDGLVPTEVLQDCHDTRAFMASLYLLLQAFPSSGTGRIGGEKAAAASDAGRSGAWWATRDEVLKILGPASEGGKDWTGLAEALRSATITTDSLRLRSLLLGMDSLPASSMLHLRLVNLALPPFRSRAWRTLQRAYMSVPFDGALCGTSFSSQISSWLEERLLLDVYLCPLSDEEIASAQTSTGSGSGGAKPKAKGHSKAAPPLDDWDEASDALSGSVNNLSLSQGDPASFEVTINGCKLDRGRLNEVRARRLAAFLDSVSLAPMEAGGAGDGAVVGTALAKWKGRIVDAPGTKDGAKGFKVR